jgi:hypothetical protein
MERLAYETRACARPDGAEITSRIADRPQVRLPEGQRAGPVPSTALPGLHRFLCVVRSALSDPTSALPGAGIYIRYDMRPARWRLERHFARVTTGLTYQPRERYEGNGRFVCVSLDSFVATPAGHEIVGRRKGARCELFLDTAMSHPMKLLAYAASCSRPRGTVLSG